MTPYVGRRILVYTHRWLGIAGSLLFVSWFASGVVMMYARMPRLLPEQREARLPPLDLSTARIAPAAAARALPAPPQVVTVGMLNDRPVYRFFDGRDWRTVYADSGQPLSGLSPNEAMRVASLFARQASGVVHDTRLEEPDQWTLQARALLPMHRIALNDTERTHLYVSDRTGEAVLQTTRASRTWGYLGAVIHWIYFTPLRRHSETWAQLIIWTSLAGCLLCLSGLAWGIWRYSPSSRYRLKHAQSHSPYAGLMRWHHYAGLVFGLASFTWVLSGLLSMNPWDWSPSTSPSVAQAEAVAGGPLRLDAITLERAKSALTSAGVVPRELQVAQFRGEVFFLVSPKDVTRKPFSLDQMEAAARDAMPGVAVEDVLWLNEYDSYYYDRNATHPLPVVRVRFADADRTWLYLDPGRGAIVRTEQRLTRINRWLYHGLHSLDFPWLYSRRPLWDVVVIGLSLGGIALSVTSMNAALRRLRRHARHWRGAAVP